MADPAEGSSSSSPLRIQDSDGSPLAQTGDARKGVVRVSVDARGWALGILSTVAVVMVLREASVFFISLLTGILLAYMLNPLVTWLERHKVRRAIGATVVMFVLISGIVFGLYSLRTPVGSLIDSLPDLATKLSAGLSAMKSDQGGGWQRLQNAVHEMEKAARVDTPPAVDANATPGSTPALTPSAARAAARSAAAAARQAAASAQATSQGAAPTSAEQSPFRLGNILLTGSLGILGFLGQASMVAFLVFFLLIAGDTFKRKLVRLTGPTLSQKKITVQILDDINNSVQRYMGVLFVTNVTVGLLTWLMLLALGFDSAIGLGVAAGLLHVIPYFGPAITAVLMAMAGVVQTDLLSTGLVAAAGSLVIATVVGMLVTTWMTGRMARMNATAVFVSLLFWGWLWGVWGLLLGIPIIVIVKVVSEHVEQLQPVSELLGD